MPLTRLILAILLLAAPMLCAQQQAGAREGEAIKAVPNQGAAHAGKAKRQNHESMQITINFRVYEDEKRVTDRSYTLAVTTGEIMPVIRDDRRVHATPSDAARSAVAPSDQYLDHDIDVDILDIQRTGNSIFVGLRISTKYYSLNGPKGPPSYPIITDTHQYLITPTIPIGKLITVYAATQVNNREREEVQLLVQPFDAQQPAPQ
jgi:hypothetical protein